MTGPTGISQPSQPSEYRPPRHIRALLDRAPKTPHHLVDPDAQQEAALRLAMEGAKPANAAVLLSNFSLHAPKQPTAQTRNADIPVPSGNLKRGFTSDGESDDENIFEGGETAEIRENKKLHVYTSPRGFGF